jgi:phage tail protein X
MTAIYVTRDGDMVDEIAFKQYGSTANRVVEQILAANPGLSDLGPILAAGVSITLPDIDMAAKTQGVTLWS